MPGKGVSVAGAALAAGGALLVYSGIMGKGFSQALRGIISGKAPSAIPAGAYPIASASPETLLASDPGSSNPGSTADLGLPANVVPSNASETAWITAMLTSIGAPATSANIKSVTAWITMESVYPGNGFNTGGLYNPLNTTLDESGATDYNSVGVKNYVSEAQGLAATAATLLGGQYSDVVSALRSGNGLCGQSFSGLSAWSGGGYSRVC